MASSNLILAIDCSFKSRTLVLLNDNASIASVSELDEKSHSIALLSALDALMTRQKIQLKDVMRVIFCRGPGGYSSLRVGFATLTGLLWQSEAQVWPVSSLLIRCLSIPGCEVRRILCLTRGSVGKFCVGIWDPLTQSFHESLLDENAARVLALDILANDGQVCGDGAVSLGLALETHADKVFVQDAVSPSAFTVLATQFAGDYQPLAQVAVRYFQGPL